MVTVSKASEMGNVNPVSEIGKVSKAAPVGSSRCGSTFRNAQGNPNRSYRGAANF
jgi:hypothetical protein